MTDTVRRLVTGETGRGTEAEWTQVQVLEPEVYGEVRSYQVWGWDEVPTLPSFDKVPYELRSYFPAAGGMRLQAMIFPPGFRAGGADPSVGYETAIAARRKLTEAVPHGRISGDEPGMHRTDTIDLGFVVYGEIVSVLEGGGEQILRPGDVYIQNGAMHAWRNDSDKPAFIWTVILGTTRDE